MSPPPAATTAIGGLSPTAFSSLFQAINGLRNGRALIAMLACVVAGVLVTGVFSMLGAFFAVIGGLVLFIAIATGVNAAGVLLMDQARELPSRPLGAAIRLGLACIPKSIVLGLMLFASALAVFVVLALAYFVCKIPLIGPILFVAVFPLSVLIAGLTSCGLFLCLFLALPAIWDGASITHALAQAFAIARSRLVESLLLLAVVWLLALAVGIIVFGVLVTGLMPTLGLAGAILGGDGLFAAFGAAIRGGQEVGGAMASGGAYALAGGIGAGVLWAVAGSVVSLVSLLGLNLVYLRVTEGLDAGAAEEALRAGLAEARRGAADLGQKAKEAAERARASAAAVRASSTPASTPTSPSPPPTAPVPSSEATRVDLSHFDQTGPISRAVTRTATCPQCLSAVGVDDVYCGVCGHRLK